MYVFDIQLHRVLIITFFRETINKIHVFYFYYLQIYKATNLANLADPFFSSNPTRHSFFTLGLRVRARGSKVS